MRLYHDNASSQTLTETKTSLINSYIGLMSHPSYSLDLAPNNFFFCPQIKHNRRSQHFSTPEEARLMRWECIFWRQHVLETVQSGWQKCFHNWLERMQNYIELIGAYFGEKKRFSILFFSLIPKYKKQSSQKTYLHFNSSKIAWPRTFLSLLFFLINFLMLLFN